MARSDAFTGLLCFDTLVACAVGLVALPIIERWGGRRTIDARNPFVRWVWRSALWIACQLPAASLLCMTWAVAIKVWPQVVGREPFPQFQLSFLLIPPLGAAWMCIAAVREIRHFDAIGWPTERPGLNLATWYRKWRSRR